MRLQNLPYHIRHSNHHVRNDNDRAPSTNTQRSQASVAMPILLPTFSAQETESSWFPQAPQVDLAAPAKKPHKKKRRKFGHRLKKFFKKVVKPFKKIFAPVMKILSKIPVVNKIVSAVKAVTSGFKTLKSLFTGNWKELGKNLWTFVKNGIGALPIPGASAIQKGLEIAEKVYLSIKAGVKGQWGKMIGGIASTLTSAFGGGKLTSFFTEKLPKLTDFVNKAVDFGRDVKDKVVSILDEIPDSAKSIVSWLGSFITNKLPDNGIVSNIRDVVKSDQYDRAA